MKNKFHPTLAMAILAASMAGTAWASLPPISDPAYSSPFSAGGYHGDPSPAAGASQSQRESAATTLYNLFLHEVRLRLGENARLEVTADGIQVEEMNGQVVATIAIVPIGPQGERAAKVWIRVATPKTTETPADDIRRALVAKLMK